MKLDDILEVRAVKKKVVRGGKLVKKKKCPPGYKLVDGKKCVKMKSTEKLARRKGAKRGNLKGKSKRKISRKKSLKVRSRRGL